MLCTIELGSTSGPPDNRTFLLTPSDDTVTEMDTAAYVCVPANTLIQAIWSAHANSIIGTNNFTLTITNVTENATVSCTVDSNTISASLTVQGKSFIVDNRVGMFNVIMYKYVCLHHTLRY